MSSSPGHRLMYVVPWARDLDADPIVSSEFGRGTTVNFPSSRP